MKKLRDIGVPDVMIKSLKNQGLNKWHSLSLLSKLQLSIIFQGDQEVILNIFYISKEQDPLILSNHNIEPITDDKNAILTGIENLDRILGGKGLLARNIYLFYGEFRTGKSQIAHQIAISALNTKQSNKNDRVIFIDTEGTFRPERINDICGISDEHSMKIMERINVYKMNNINEFSLLLPSIHKLCEEKNVKLIIVDSLMHHFRKELGNKDIPYREILKKVKKLMAEIKFLAEKHNFPVYLTSPISSSSKEMYFSVKPILSNILNYYTDHWILLSVNESVPDMNNRVVRNAVIVKSINLPESTIEFIITKEGVRDFC